ncbi:MAG TPA: RNA methyltransferase [Anaerolineae bacterium]|nr:RNA methyltransferase [Anaerolineae bacterium]
MITSTQNPKIRLIHRLQTSARKRKEAGVFVIEGIRLVEESFSAGWKPQSVFYTDGLSDRGFRLIDKFIGSGVDIYKVNAEVMRYASDTQTPQGLLAIVPMHKWEIPASLDFVLILDSVRNPGNLGTILRTALAAGVDLAILPPGTVDLYSPKVVRAAMGAHFRMPILQIDWDEIRELVKPLRVYLADVKGRFSCFDSQFQIPLALIMGGEAKGAGSEARLLANETIFIPMLGKAESLNAAIAAAILMFEVLRQRGMVNE